jgi:hypothetical protein
MWHLDRYVNLEYIYMLWGLAFKLNLFYWFIPNGTWFMNMFNAPMYHNLVHHIFISFIIY